MQQAIATCNVPKFTPRNSGISEIDYGLLTRHATHIVLELLDKEALLQMGSAFTSVTLAAKLSFAK